MSYWVIFKSFNYLETIVFFNCSTVKTEPLLNVDTFDDNNQSYFPHFFIFLCAKNVLNSGCKTEGLSRPTIENLKVSGHIRLNSSSVPDIDHIVVYVVYLKRLRMRWRSCDNCPVDDQSKQSPVCCNLLWLHAWAGPPGRRCGPSLRPHGEGWAGWGDSDIIKGCDITTSTPKPPAAVRKDGGVMGLIFGGFLCFCS